jgi:hypothetical protein
MAAFGSLFGPTQFQSYFSIDAEAGVFPNITKSFCEEPLRQYHQQFYNVTKHLNYHVERTDRCNAVLNCILDHLTPAQNIRVSANGVLLGLTPTILAVLGSTTTEIGLLSSRRPLLSFFLSVGAPVINPRRLFEDANLEDILKKRKTRRAFPRTIKGKAPLMVTLIEYLLVLASIANLVEVTYELGYKTVSLGGDCSARWNFLVWAFVPCSIHLFSAILFALVFRIREKRGGRSGWGTVVGRWLGRESTVCATHRPSEIERRQETLFQLFLSVLISLMIIAHLIFGSLYFSAIVLLFSLDGLLIVIRLLASTLVCRIITAFEISGMRETIRLSEDGHGSVETLIPHRLQGDKKS